MDIEFHIEALVLHGFSPGDKLRIAAALQGELMRLLARQGILPRVEQDFQRARLDGGSFSVRTGERPDSIGVRVGRAVYDGMASGALARKEFFHERT